MNMEERVLKQVEQDSVGMRLCSEDFKGLKMVGEIEDKIYKNGVLIDTRIGHNLVVNQFLNLVMALLKGQSGYAGINYWAIGQGASSWDSSMPSPTLTDNRLTSEIGRVAISASDIKFLTSGGSESSVPTNILEIKHTFGVNDCNGKWREFGLFGGNATATANSGIMINKRNHEVITKTSDMVVERTMRFTLTLG